MRSVVFRYLDIAALSGALSETRGSLPLPEGETVGDGEWVLAIFEIGSRRRATAAAARGVRAAGDTHLEFERRDWDRLVGFVAARSEHMRAARPSAGPTSSGRIAIASEAPALPAVSEAPPRSRRLDDIPASTPIESSRIPFGARVLVVDADGGAGGELRAMLAEMGLVVELVSTTKSAEERMSAQAFDAIVLDLHARGSDSRAFVGKLRGDARIADIPVLFLSSKPTSRDVVDAFASGGDDFLPKPFRTPELAARIFGLLRRARMARGAVGSQGR
ncbi:MAG: response regulator [Labilithrix sp.]|nr:response regulator [Labilithrix sp.]